MGGSHALQETRRHEAEEVIYSQSAKAEGPREIGNPTGAFVYPKNVLPYDAREIQSFSREILIQCRGHPTGSIGPVGFLLFNARKKEVRPLLHQHAALI